MLVLSFNKLTLMNKIINKKFHKIIYNFLTIIYNKMIYFQIIINNFLQIINKLSLQITINNNK